MSRLKPPRQLSRLLCRAALAALAVVPASLPAPAQAPAQPGKLVVKSTPPGAVITINGRRMPQPTDATFVVPAGNYKVSVSGGAGRLNCSTQSFRVNSVGTTEVQCTANGWAGQR